MNVFVTLNKWSHRQFENFTTDSFAVVLTRFIQETPENAGRILELLTDSMIGRRDVEKGKVEVATQVHTTDGIPDIEIRTSNKLALIEVKTGAPLGKNQLQSYRKVLGKSGAEEACLVLLTNYIVGAERYPADHSLRWYQVTNLMEEMLVEGNLPPVPDYLAREFLEYMRSINMALHQVNSKLSEALNTHRQLHPDDMIETRRIRSLARVADHDELEPLHNILQLMGHALDQLGIEPKPKFDSGQQYGGWLGYNIERTKYWFCIYYPSPDALVFETLISKGHVANKAPLMVGEYVPRGNYTYWINTLDLAEQDGEFFKLDRNEQLAKILDFARLSYAQARAERAGNT